MKPIVFNGKKYFPLRSTTMSGGGYGTCHKCVVVPYDSDAGYLDNNMRKFCHDFAQKQRSTDGVKMCNRHIWAEESDAVYLEYAAQRLDENRKVDNS